MCRVSPGGTDVYALHEFTSSGFTHTFTHQTLDKPTLGEAAGEADSRGAAVPITSRGALNEFVYHLYRAASPVYHREHKGELYHRPHFSLLDISLDGREGGGGRRYKPLMVDFRVVDYKNETVLSRMIRTRELSQGAGSSHPIPESQVCTLFHGEIPRYKLLALRAAVAAFLMLVVVCPVCTVLWFLGASIYYVWFGSELERRAVIEDRNRTILESRKKKN